jgi:hypothetical protein
MYTLSCQPTSQARERLVPAHLWSCHKERRNSVDEAFLLITRSKRRECEVHLQMACLAIYETTITVDRGKAQNWPILVTIPPSSLSQ